MQQDVRYGSTYMPLEEVGRDVQGVEGYIKILILLSLNSVILF